MLNVKEPEEKTLEELQDGGHILVACSSCRAILMDIWRTRPDEPDVWKIRARCPFCGDSSFIQEIKGGFHQGGYGLLTDDEDVDAASTIVDGFDFDQDVIVFTIKKASPHARAIRARF